MPICIAWLWKAVFLLAFAAPLMAEEGYKAAAHAKLNIPKVALMFITKGPMPHEAAWVAWFRAARWLVPKGFAAFQNCTEGSAEVSVQPKTTTHRNGSQHFIEQILFSMYIHSPPTHNEYEPDSLFWQHSIPNRVQVVWGDHSMVVAMKYLLKAALAEPLNERFIYLCELTVPLYAPTLIWQQLMAENISRVNACPIPRRSRRDPAKGLWRWTPEMLPLVPRASFRKSSQWVGLTREHAMLADQDLEIFDLFDQHCRHPGCIGDEHYFPTLLAVKGVDTQTSCAGNAVASIWAQGLHPKTFSDEDVDTDMLLALRQNSRSWRKRPPCDDAGAIKLASAQFVQADSQWRVPCSFNSTQSYNATLLSRRPCALFARKFSPSTADKILEAVSSCDPKLAIAPTSSCSSPTR